MEQRFSGEHPGMEKSLDESENSSSARRTNPPDNNHADDFNTINTRRHFLSGLYKFFFIMTHLLFKKLYRDRNITI